ncbi:Mitochondrial import receptor subunit tom22 [Penicillium riverlandense]|uniref:Mitochondrial import receptor subunit tom22 n=1 Tax=Penicillium riverlandense TaxID=1903569 RepID=UPI0025497BE7|nr:Mitochondrial import receptor subunit tom22 [Penicillium riverlandense]KAJ5832138.1 Mitochondrial import receptor subunit tom22 [Penicillium riverlandense]
MVMLLLTAFTAKKSSCPFFLRHLNTQLTLLFSSHATYNTANMVKLEEFEDEHFNTEKPTSTKNDALLVSDDEDYSDTESEISNDSDVEVEGETLFDRVSALKDMIPPSARRTVSSSVSSLTSFTKAGLSFSGKAVWIISTSAFLIGVPWALAYAEEEQYIQMEREQGMIRGANESLTISSNFQMLTPGAEPEKKEAEATL